MSPFIACTSNCSMIFDPRAPIMLNASSPKLFASSVPELGLSVSVGSPVVCFDAFFLIAAALLSSPAAFLLPAVAFLLPDPAFFIPAALAGVAIYSPTSSQISADAPGLRNQRQQQLPRGVSPVSISPLQRNQSDRTPKPSPQVDATPSSGDPARDSKGHIYSGSALQSLFQLSPPQHLFI